MEHEYQPIGLCFNGIRIRFVYGDYPGQRRQLQVAEAEPNRRQQSGCAIRKLAGRVCFDRRDFDLPDLAGTLTGICADGNFKRPFYY